MRDHGLVEKPQMKTWAPLRGVYGQPVGCRRPGVAGRLEVQVGKLVLVCQGYLLLLMEIQHTELHGSWRGISFKYFTDCYWKVKWNRTKCLLPDYSLQRVGIVVFRLIIIVFIYPSMRSCLSSYPFESLFQTFVFYLSVCLFDCLSSYPSIKLTMIHYSCVIYCLMHTAKTRYRQVFCLFLV